MLRSGGPWPTPRRVAQWRAADGKTTLVQELATAPGSQYFTLDDAATLALAAGDPSGFIRNLTARCD